MDERMRALQKAWHGGDVDAGRNYLCELARKGEDFPLEELVQHTPLEIGPALRGYGVALADFREQSCSSHMAPVGVDGQYRPWTLSEMFRARLSSIRAMLGVAPDVSLRTLGDVLRVGVECFETQCDRDGSRLSAQQRAARLLWLNYVTTASGHHYHGGTTEFAFKRESEVLSGLSADDARIVIPQVYNPQGGIVFQAGLRVGRHQGFNALLPRGVPARHPYWVDGVAQGDVKLVEDFETAHYAAHEMRYGTPEGAMGVWVPLNEQGVFPADELRPVWVCHVYNSSGVIGLYIDYINSDPLFVRVANQSERSEPQGGRAQGPTNTRAKEEVRL